MNQSIQLGPDDYEALFCRGNLRAARGEQDAALADYGAALKLEPAFSRAYFQRALMYVAREQMTTALADYRQTVRLAPQSPDVYKTWGRAEDKASRGAAVDRLEALLEQSKPEARSRSQQGTVFHKAGDLDKAIAEYDQALELYPRYTEIYYNRGLAYRQKGEMDKAIHDYTQAIELDPKYIPAYSNRAFAYFKKNDLDRALADYDKILQLDPTNDEAKKSREAILAMRSGGGAAGGD